MVKKLMLSFLASICLAWSVSADVPTTTATAPAKIRLIGQLGLVKVTDLDFGSIAIAGTSVSISLAPTSGRVEPSVVGDAQVIASSNPTASKLTVTGYDNSTFVITVPETVTLSDVSGKGGANMTMTLTCDQPGVAPTFSSALVGGTKDFYLGGTLSVGVNQVPSNYQGTFTVSVNYN